MSPMYEPRPAPAEDFRAECDALSALLDGESDDVFDRVTQFKSWTIEDVLAHLHMWNIAAAETLASRERFQALFAFVMTRMAAGDNHPAMQRAWLDEFHGGVRGRALFDQWRTFYPTLADQYGDADPETRVAWAGPDMNVGAKIIARQMETWAHGQEVFDCLGATRENTDRIGNIVDLGVRTYSWAFRNRGQTPPAPKPFVSLTSPAGERWEWNKAQTDNSVTGAASDFAAVVTQTRNIADTSLVAIGDIAKGWMAIAQCFAGAPNDPPPEGARYRVSSR